MQFAYTACAYFAGLLLDILVIAALWRNGYRRFPFLLVYVIVDFLTSISEIRPVLALNNGATEEVKKAWAAVYWWNERVIQVLVFLIVISLAYRATAHIRPRRALLTCVVIGTAVFAGISFAIHFDSQVNTGIWMTPWTRDLNFTAAILNLGLWAVLIASREKDHRILMVAGGLGIQFTGGAIGQAFRDFSMNWQLVVGDIMYLSNLACLYIWWQAFRQPRNEGRPSSEPPRVANTSFRTAPK
jgi:hypothetical protein